jgi:hypothetical protein
MTPNAAEIIIEPATPTSESPTPTRTLVGFRLVCLGLAGLLVAGIVFSDVVTSLLHSFGTWLTALAGMAAAALTALAIWLRPVINCVGKTAIRRVGLLVGLCAVLSVTLFFAIALVAQSDAYKILVLRSVFLLVAALLPAILYWMFIATRKSSLFYEFVSSINRLGLFAPRLWPPEEPGGSPRHETEPERRRRVAGYLQRFEASYGPLPADTRKRVVCDQDPDFNGDANAEQTRVPLWSLLSSETVVPVLVLTLLVTFLWIPVLLREFLVSGNQQFRAYDPLWIELSPMIAAFLGAYFFSMQALFRRYVRKDLRPGAYVGATQRIVLATVGTWVLHSLVMLSGVTAEGAHTRDALIVLGFTVGVFPRVVWQYIQGAVKKLMPTSSVLPSLDTPAPISDLDGLTVWHQARLEEEDIENLPNMATADILDLMLSTKFPPDRLIDWADQAILYTHLGPEELGSKGAGSRGILRGYGIRTATGLIEAFRRAQARESGREFQTIIPGGPPSPIRTLVDSLETVPNLKLIRTWRGLMPSSVVATAAVTGNGTDRREFCARL